MIHIKTPQEIEKMRRAGCLSHEVIHTLGEAAKAGVTTGELDDLASRIITERGGSSPCLGYAPHNHPPYPGWTCISVNNEVVHGIPGRRVLCEGDIVTIDCCVELGGWMADSAWTFPVGRVSQQADRLLKITEEALLRGIAQAKPGNRTGDIGHAVQRYAETNRCSVVRELTGHGVGKSMHEEPQVENVGSRGKGTVLKCGMTFAIEPMLNAGRRDVEFLEDQWTVVTADGNLSAHFEHTVAIVPHGAMILTNGA